jgi:Fe-S-cluster containining protein
LPNARVDHWLRCAQKTCCAYYVVYVTGDDVVRIARTLAVPAWTFTAAMPNEEARPDAFALDHSGSRHRLALVRTRLQPDTRPFCTFLVRATDGAARCGLGEGRPAPCRSFPANEIDGAIRFENAGCTCDWSGVTADESADRALLSAEGQAREKYGQIVAAWNDYVGRFADPFELTHRDFCRYLMDAYNQ